MELLVELLLTMVLSVLIGVLLGKIVSFGAPDGDDPDARGAAEGAVDTLVPGKHPLEVAASVPPVVVSGEAVGEAEATGGIVEGREIASGSGDDCAEADEGRRVEEIVQREEVEETVGGVALVSEEAGGEEEVEEAVEGVALVSEDARGEDELVEAVEGLALVSEDARAEESGVEEAGGGKKIPEDSVTKVEEKLAYLTPELIGRALSGLAIEGKLPLAEDAGRVVNIALSLDEEKEKPKESDSGEVGTASGKEGESPAMVESDDEKAVPYGVSVEGGLESKDGAPETSVKYDKVGSLFNEDDDWEGIEKTDLEKLFAAATAFVGSNEGTEALTKLSSDLQMQLYGLHKIATEGPCYESQPMSLKVSARAKWHAWQRLGSMNPEMAMEHYIALVSDNIPGWIPQKNRVDDNLIEECKSPDKGVSGSGVSSSQLEDQFFQKRERDLECHSSYVGEHDVPVVSQDTEQGDHATGSSFL